MRTTPVDMQHLCAMHGETTTAGQNSKQANYSKVQLSKQITVIKVKNHYSKQQTATTTRAMHEMHACIGHTAINAMKR